MNFNKEVKSQAKIPWGESDWLGRYHQGYRATFPSPGFTTAILLQEIGKLKNMKRSYVVFVESHQMRYKRNSLGRQASRPCRYWWDSSQNRFLRFIDWFCLSFYDHLVLFQGSRGALLNHRKKRESLSKVYVFHRVHRKIHVVCRRSSPCVYSIFLVIGNRSNRGRF
jgi:hypothetical protein